MNQLILGRYFPGESILHRLDPRAKIVAAVLFILIVFIAKNWLSFLLLWAFTFWLMSTSGVTYRTYFRGIKPMIWLILFVSILQMLFTTGHHIFFAWGPITISDYGIKNGIFIFFRFTLITLVSTVVTLTTKPIDLTDGIHSLMKPLAIIKVPVDELAMMFGIAFRFIPNLIDETQKIMDAQRLRGTVFGEGNLFQQMKSLVPVFLPLFVNSLNRAEELANIMDVRGYRAGVKRSSFRRLRWRACDSLSLFIMGLLTVLLFYLN